MRPGEGGRQVSEEAPISRSSQLHDFLIILIKFYIWNFKKKASGHVQAKCSPSRP